MDTPADRPDLVVPSLSAPVENWETFLLLFRIGMRVFGIIGLWTPPSNMISNRNAKAMRQAFGVSKRIWGTENANSQCVMSSVRGPSRAVRRRLATIELREDPSVKLREQIPLLRKASQRMNVET
jgi:hypothetical protein